MSSACLEQVRVLSCLCEASFVLGFSFGFRCISPGRKQFAHSYVRGNKQKILA